MLTAETSANTATRMADLILTLRGSSGRADPAATLRLVERARAEGSEANHVQAARTWAGDFAFPQSTLAADATIFAANGSNVAASALARQRDMAASRLSPSRITRSFAALPSLLPGMYPTDLARLNELAVTGIRLFLPDNYVPCASPPPLREKYVLVATAVNKLLAA